MGAITKRPRPTSQPAEVTRELVQQWEAQRPGLKALNDATLDKPRGHAIPVVEAMALAGGEDAFRKAATYWKRSLLWLRGITVEYEHSTKAYRLIEVERHLTKRHDRILRATERRHREESLRLALMRDADMESDHQRRLRMMVMEQHNTSAGRIESQREFVRLALIQPETLPRIGGNGDK